MSKLFFTKKYPEKNSFNSKIIEIKEMYCTFLILELKHSFLPRYSIHVYMQISAVMHQAH